MNQSAKMWRCCGNTSESSDSKVGCTVWLRESYYVAQHRTGFMRVDVLRNKGVLLRVYAYEGSGRGGLAYSRWLELR